MKPIDVSNLEVPDLGASQFGLDQLLLTPEERQAKQKKAGAAAEALIGAPPLQGMIDTLFPKAHRSST